MPHLKKSAFLTVTACLALLALISPVFVSEAHAETPAPSWVTVNPTTPAQEMYITWGQNRNFTFEARWAYGADAGQLISNGTVIIKVISETTGKTVDSLCLNTTTGAFEVSYMPNTADALTFNTVQFFTADRVEYNSSAFNGDGGVIGLQAEPLTVWWDTFHVSVVKCDTATVGATGVTLNVTYLLVPEEGLALPENATDSHQTFLPKAAQNATVTINGVQAEQTAPGIYTAEVSSLFADPYVHVGVSQEGWSTISMGFRFTHAGNDPIWLFGTAVVAAIVAVAIGLRLVSTRKNRKPLAQSYPFIGGVLLAAVSAISLYWALIGAEGIVHGFDWALLAVLGAVAAGLGLAGAAFAFKRRNQAFILFATCLPMIANLVPVHTALAGYMFPTPWVSIGVALAACLAAMFLISNSDRQFNQSV